MTMSEFDTDTAVRPAEGGWVGEINERWNVGDHPNGGYTLAVAARAMLDACDRPDPLTITAHYVAPPHAGPVAIRTETVRAGRRYATVAGSLLQGDRELIRLLGAFGDLSAQVGPTRVGATMPQLPPPEECLSLRAMSEAGGRRAPRVIQRYDLRLDPDCQWVRSRGDGPGDPGPAGAVDEPPAPMEVGGWIRFADGAPPSVVGLLAMADAFPPTLVGAVDVGWVPTVELTVHLRGRPAPGWILGLCQTRFLIDGVLEQDGELWDSTGRLVALCRQMALALPRR
jgi:acyl-CoA thioesterase